VRDLVGQEMLSKRIVGLIRAGGEVDVVADRKRARVEGGGGGVTRGIVVDLDRPEVGAEGRLELRPRRGRQRLTAAAPGLPEAFGQRAPARRDAPGSWVLGVRGIEGPSGVAHTAAVPGPAPDVTALRRRQAAQ
jgi:hypothetical protein